MLHRPAFYAVAVDLAKVLSKLVRRVLLKVSVYRVKLPSARHLHDQMQYKYHFTTNTCYAWHIIFHVGQPPLVAGLSGLE
jgi:hypothetical protein